MDDLLIITKGSLEDHLEKLSMVLTRLQEAGLRINANKSNFCTLEMDTSGYTHKRWYQTTAEQGTSDACISTAQKCQRTLQIPGDGSIL